MPPLLLLYSTTSTAELLQQQYSSTAAAAVAVGHTRPGSASRYTWLVGLTLEYFVQVLDFVVCFLVPQLKIRHNLKRHNLQPDVCPTELFVAGAAATAAVQHLQQSFSRFSAPSSVGGWA